MKNNRTISVEKAYRIFCNITEKHFGTCAIEDFSVYFFKQLWGSTALGFEGIGASVMTEAETLILTDMRNKRAIVFFGERFAYLVTKVNNTFLADMRDEQIASVYEAKTKYGNIITQ